MLVQYNGTRRKLVTGKKLSKSVKADANAPGGYVYRVLHPRAVALKCLMHRKAVIVLMVNLGIQLDDMRAADDDTLSKIEDS